MKKIRIAVDCNGFENPASEAISACKKFIKQHNDVEFVLTGEEKEFKKYVKKRDVNIKTINTTQKVIMGENPIISLRNTDSSMYRAISEVEKNNADAVVSAGSTASFVMLTQKILKVINGVEKVGFTCFIPTIIKGKSVALVDCGANLNCTGKDLYKFAAMAKILRMKAQNVKNPKVGVINIGTEDHKGHPYHFEAHELLKKDKNINYKGYVEPREILKGELDICVSDGYSGNLVLKSLEGGLKSLAGLLKKGCKRNPLGAIFFLPNLLNVIKTFDYKRHSAAVVLGLNKIAIKTHGNADEKQFYSAIELAYKSVKADVANQIKQNLKKNVKVR
jgi:glycerol-3-phosphate acyltransferase PlsX